MEALKDSVISKIRSCLISTKGQVTVRQLEDDYYLLLGERIPYRNLGHSTLESLLLSIPSLSVTRSMGQVFVDAKMSEKSAHISTMVAKQKSSAPKRKLSKLPPRRYQNKPVMTHTPNRWRPQQSYPANSANQRLSRRTTRLQSHNQFVNAYPKPTASSKIVVPEHYVRIPEHHVRVPEPIPEHHVRVPEPIPERKIQTPPTPAVSTPSPPPPLIENGDVNVLNSTKKRITRLMSEVSLDRDSGNSSPTGDFKEKVFEKTGDPTVDLRNFVEFHKLTDFEVRITENRPKKSKNSFYHCKIKVCQNSYSSYPVDSMTEEDATKIASEKALDDVITKYSRRKSLLVSSTEDILERIPPMLEKHQGAIWMWQMEADYIDRFNEQLPLDWLKIIDSSSYVSFEKYPGGYVLKYCSPDTGLQKGEKIDFVLGASDVSVACNTVDFREEGKIYAMVTAAPSVNEIWCQQIDTDEYAKFIKMTTTMEQYYNSNFAGLVAKNISLRSCYAVKHDGIWLRVRAVGLEDTFVNCFMLDYGLELYIPKSDVCMLKREFATVQAQAFVCRLEGLDELNEVSVDSEHLQKLVEKEVILEMVADENGEKSDVTFPVIMYDETGKSINEELAAVLTYESATPVLNKTGVTDVYVTNIESNGEVYVQIRNSAYSTLQEMLREIEVNLGRQVAPPVTKSNSADRLYLIRYKVTGRWLRVSIVDWSPNLDMAQIYYVDYGNADVINVAREMLYPLDQIDEFAAKYPPQAIKVRIMLETIPEDFVEMATKLMPPDQMILLKITSYDNENVAWVEFFKRSLEGGLFSVNRSVALEVELQKKVENNNKGERNSKRLANMVFNDNTKNVPSGGSLRKPDLPAKGQYFNVNIPFAVNPWNFFVQPLDSHNQLTALMKEMQDHFNNIEYGTLALEDIVPGNIYASKHEDGKWYRTSVLKVIHSTSISVFYCDFGYYTNLSLRQLVPLDLNYLNFPYQALKAKLDGLKPTKNKWTVEDCEFFKDLVQHKQYVSVLVDVEKDELYKSDNVLKLILIDTTGKEDVYVKDILINRGMAVNN